MAHHGQMGWDVDHRSTLVAHEVMVGGQIVVVLDGAGSELQHLELAQVDQLTKDLVDGAQRHVGYRLNDCPVNLFGSSVTGHGPEGLEHGHSLTGDLQVGFSESLGQGLRAAHPDTIPNSNNDCWNYRGFCRHR